MPRQKKTKDICGKKNKEGEATQMMPFCKSTTTQLWFQRKKGGGGEEILDKYFCFGQTAISCSLDEIFLVAWTKWPHKYFSISLLAALHSYKSHWFGNHSYKRQRVAHTRITCTRLYKEAHKLKVGDRPPMLGSQNSFYGGFLEFTLGWFLSNHAMVCRQQSLSLTVYLLLHGH